MTELEPEDDKLLTLARATMRRLGTGSAAAVRDDTGRTYVSGPVELNCLRLSALQAAVTVALGQRSQRTRGSAGGDSRRTSVG